jgi:hypothetical protein
MGFINDNREATLFTMAILVIGIIGYFLAGGVADKAMSFDVEFFKSLQVKAAFEDDNSLELYVLPNYNKLSMYKAAEGNSLPEQGTMVLGFEEARMMREEKEFSKIGDNIDNLFGVDVQIEGILAETGTIIDDMHFMSSRDFDTLKGEKDKVFIKLLEGNIPKVFYRLQADEKLPNGFRLTDGSMSDYSIKEISGEKFYPMVVGFEEAKMMKEEKLFSKPGDTIKGFFGNNIFIAGTLKKSNSSLDMMHFLPLGKEDLK